MLTSTQCVKCHFQPSQHKETQSYTEGKLDATETELVLQHQAWWHRPGG